MECYKNDFNNKENVNMENIDNSVCIDDMIRTLANDVVSLLKSRNMIISVAESCTGGMLASSIVDISGASSVFKEGYITYCDAAKNKILGVTKETLDKYKAVSGETACEMATGVYKNTTADICISITGVAGPDMEDDKPVGLVYIGAYFNGNVNAFEYHFEGDRLTIRKKCVLEALRLIKGLMYI